MTGGKCAMAIASTEHPFKIHLLLPKFFRKAAVNKFYMHSIRST